MTGLVIRSIIAAFGLSLVIMIALAGVAQADPVVPGEEHCVVNVRSTDRLNMRAQPSARAEIVARKRYGDCGFSSKRSAAQIGVRLRMATALVGCIGTTSQWSRPPCIVSQASPPGMR